MMRKLCSKILKFCIVLLQRPPKGSKQHSHLPQIPRKLFNLLGHETPVADQFVWQPRPICRAVFSSGHHSILIAYKISHSRGSTLQIQRGLRLVSQCAFWTQDLSPRHRRRWQRLAFLGIYSCPWYTCMSLVRVSGIFATLCSPGLLSTVESQHHVLWNAEVTKILMDYIIT